MDRILETNFMIAISAEFIDHWNLTENAITKYISNLIVIIQISRAHFMSFDSNQKTQTKQLFDAFLGAYPEIDSSN